MEVCAGGGPSRGVGSWLRSRSRVTGTLTRFPVTSGGVIMPWWRRRCEGSKVGWGQVAEDGVSAVVAAEGRDPLEDRRPQQERLGCCPRRLISKAPAEPPPSLARTGRAPCVVAKLKPAELATANCIAPPLILA
jgi:hypothetical protein